MYIDITPVNANNVKGNNGTNVMILNMTNNLYCLSENCILIFLSFI